MKKIFRDWIFFNENTNVVKKCNYWKTVSDINRGYVIKLYKFVGGSPSPRDASIMWWILWQSQDIPHKKKYWLVCMITGGDCSSCTLEWERGRVNAGAGLVAPVPGRMLLLFTFLCEEIPGCAWSGHRSYGCVAFSKKDARPEGRGRVMVRSHDWLSYRPVQGIQQEFPVPWVSMGSPWHRGEVLRSRTQPCRNGRTRLL